MTGDERFGGIQLVVVRRPSRDASPTQRRITDREATTPRFDADGRPGRRGCAGGEMGLGGRRPHGAVDLPGPARRRHLGQHADRPRLRPHRQLDAVRADHRAGSRRTRRSRRGRTPSTATRGSTSTTSTSATSTPPRRSPASSRSRSWTRRRASGRSRTTTRSDVPNHLVHKAARQAPRPRTSSPTVTGRGRCLREVYRRPELGRRARLAARPRAADPAGGGGGGGPLAHLPAEARGRRALALGREARRLARGARLQAATSSRGCWRRGRGQRPPRAPRSVRGRRRGRRSTSGRPRRRLAAGPWSSPGRAGHGAADGPQASSPSCATTT